MKHPNIIRRNCRANSHETWHAHLLDDCHLFWKFWAWPESCHFFFIFLGPLENNSKGAENWAGSKFKKLVFPAISIYPASVPASHAHNSMTHFVCLLDGRSVTLNSIYIILSHFKLFQDNSCLVFYPFGLLVFKSYSLMVLTTAREGVGLVFFRMGLVSSFGNVCGLKMGIIIFNSGNTLSSEATASSKRCIVWKLFTFHNPNLF